MVSIFVGVTDNDWFDYLSARHDDEVNFWAPSGRTNFRALQPGELFLFKLHSPQNFIVGGGIFSHASLLPLSIAWEAFGEKNGVESAKEMRRRIGRYRTGDDPRMDPTIGCRILTNPFFWARDRWIPGPRAGPAILWSSVDTTRMIQMAPSSGARSWDRASLALPAWLESERYGAPILVRPRLGQGAFRVLVTDAYDRRCAVSGEKTLPILDAAHIRSYADGGEHEGPNGLLLRTDIHKLFDLGYVTVDKDLRFVVSGRLKADFDNGRHYYDLHGTTLQSPILASVLPSSSSLEWHRHNKFLG